MSDLESWIVRATVGALVAALAGVFVRLRVLESKRAAADVRLKAQEARTAPDHSEALRNIDAKLEGLSTRLAKVETKLESRSVDRLWEEHNDLTRELGSLARSVSEHNGVISQLTPLVSRLDNYLRSVQGGAKP